MLRRKPNKKEITPNRFADEAIRILGSGNEAEREELLEGVRKLADEAQARAQEQEQAEAE